jgi:hypothetical protein
MEFKKLSAVEMTETVDQAATVLIEKDGVIKRAPKNEINVQADWTETDESSPAFIKNKDLVDLDISVAISYSDETGFVFEPNINSGSFDIIKNILLQNKHPNVKIQTNPIFPGFPDVFAVESCTPFSISYIPEGMLDGNPEMVALLCNSFCADCWFMIFIMFDGNITSLSY